MHRSRSGQSSRSVHWLNRFAGQWIKRILFLILAMGGIKFATQADAAWLRPMEGVGHFQFTCDVVTFTREDGLFDAVFAVSVRHSELTFTKEASSMVARLRATAAVRGPQHQTASTETTKRLLARDESEAESPTLQQVFLVTLRGIDFDHGELQFSLEDLNRRRPVIASLVTQEQASSSFVADWIAPPGRHPNGLSVCGVAYLAHAPIRTWEQSGRASGELSAGPWDYTNPMRRYGLEAEALQLYFNLEPPSNPAARNHAAGKDLRLEITSDRYDFSLVDTLRLAPSIRASLAAGRTAAVYWEMDAAGLPPGSYRLGIAPLDTAGRGFLSSFDMVWRMLSLSRSPTDLQGEGRTVLRGNALREFEAATNADREVMLAVFWKDLDPDPADPYNEVYAEFLRRLAYVRVFLGGFDEAGARDPRGRIYLYLGEPNSIVQEPVPMNERELEDARVKVYERFAPERVGTTAKSIIGMPYSDVAMTEIRTKKTAVDVRVFQLWRYDHAGSQLFPNPYSDLGGGLRFLFVDRTGLGDFVLDASNTMLRGD